MEGCLLTNFIFNNEIKSCCDFNQFEFENNIVVYEVLRVIDGIPLFLQEHIKRFFESLRINKLDAEISERQLKTRLRVLIEINKLSTGNIRFQLVFPEGQTPIFYAWISPFFYPTKTQYVNGVDCNFYLSIRPTPNAKIVMQKTRESILKVIKTNGIFEVILHDSLGEISEGSKSNLFFLRNNALYTSPNSKVLLGVTRSKIFELCQKLNIEIIQKPIMKNEIVGFESAFICSTSNKLLGVKSIDSTLFEPKNQIIKLLTNEYEELIKNYLSNFSWNL